MIFEGETLCPICKGELKYYDRVKRITKTKNGKKSWVYIRRYRCTKCGKLHRELPEDIYPYKHYESEVIFGVLEGLITIFTKGFEDYPCEMTIKRWKEQVK